MALVLVERYLSVSQYASFLGVRSFVISASNLPLCECVYKCV